MDAVEKFKAAWHEADAEGDEGNRVRRGLEAALTDVVREIDASPAVLWAGKGGVKERILKMIEEM